MIIKSSPRSKVMVPRMNPKLISNLRARKYPRMNSPNRKGISRFARYPSDNPWRLIKRELGFMNLISIWVLFTLRNKLKVNSEKNVIKLAKGISIRFILRLDKLFRMENISINVTVKSSIFLATFDLFIAVPFSNSNNW